MTPRDPDYAERVRTSFGHQQAMALLGAQLQAQPDKLAWHACKRIGTYALMISGGMEALHTCS